MAFAAKKIFPIDTKPGTAIGISIPFNAPAVFYSTYTTKDAIRNNLLNFFLTNKTERYLNNEFGANLRAFIFEQITNNNTFFLRVCKTESSSLRGFRRAHQSGFSYRAAWYPSCNFSGIL